MLRLRFVNDGLKTAVRYGFNRKSAEAFVNTIASSIIILLKTFC
jgi:hypothetical protein